MPTPTNDAAEAVEGQMPDHSMDLKELTALLIHHYGHHTGFFDLVLQLRIATGSFGPTKEEALPGASFNVAGVGLKRVDKLGANTLDAALVNPKLTKKRKSRSARKS